MSWLNPIVFNLLIIGLFIVASIAWAFAHNWLQAIYWLAGAVLNIVVTLGMK